MIMNMHLLIQLPVFHSFLFFLFIIEYKLFSVTFIFHIGKMGTFRVLACLIELF